MQLNIGLNGTTIAAALRATCRAHIPLTGWRVAQSATEPTLVLRTPRAVSYDTIYALAVELNQDCIAVSEGALIGPRSHDWGDFDPAYFLEF